jgi:hypothetical protein
MKAQTIKPMERVIIFVASKGDVELWHAAAAHKGISRAELLRQAAREKSGKILAGTDAAPAQNGS